MGKIENIYQATKSELLNGVFGNSGDKFLTIREFAKLREVSYVTAVKVFEKLKQDYLIIIYGNNHYIFNGIYNEHSHLYSNIISNTSGRKKIGLYIRDISNQFYMTLSQEIYNQLDKHNFDLIIMTSQNTVIDEKNVLLNFISMGCLGVLSFAGFKDKKLYDFYSRFPLPCILIGRSIKEIKVDYISTDNYLSGKQAAKHLYQCGYKQFGYIGLKRLEETNDYRYLGFKEGLEEYNCNVSPDLHFRIDLNSSINYLANCLIKSQTSVGLFCYHDLIAIKILNVCAYNKINVPLDVGIVGYDDLPICVAVNPTITSFSYNFKIFAALIVDVLFEKIRTLNKENQLYTIQTSMIIRKSTCNFNALENKKEKTASDNHPIV